MPAMEAAQENEPALRSFEDRGDAVSPEITDVASQAVVPEGTEALVSRQGGVEGRPQRIWRDI